MIISKTYVVGMQVFTIKFIQLSCMSENLYINVREKDIVICFIFQQMEICLLDLFFL